MNLSFVNEFSLEDLMDELHIIIELAITHKMQEQNVHRTCKIIRDINPIEFKYYKRYELKADFYKLNSAINAMYKYKKNVTIGIFYLYKEILVYNHIYSDFSMYVAIKRFINDSSYKHKHAGPFIIFEKEKNTIKVNKPIELSNKRYIIKSPYTQIKTMYIPSNRSTRIFVLSYSYLYAESHRYPTVINENVYLEMIKKNVIKNNLDLIPMLYNIQPHHKTIKEVELYYSELLVKKLTS
jgi:hypothetical protein